MFGKFNKYIFKFFAIPPTTIGSLLTHKPYRKMLLYDGVSTQQLIGWSIVVEMNIISFEPWISMHKVSPLQWNFCHWAIVIRVGFSWEIDYKKNLKFCPIPPYHLLGPHWHTNKIAIQHEFSIKHPLQWKLAVKTT